MLLKLFKVFFKIGLFTFGGGYGMIAIVRDECVEKNNWITNDEFLNLLTISESTPGPIAVNMATYIGYKKNNMSGAIIATLGVVIPSILVISIISLFINDFLKIKIVSDCFVGIRIAISIVIIRIGISLMLSEIKNKKYIKIKTILYFIFLLSILLLNISHINVNFIFVILIDFIIAIVIWKCHGIS